MGVEPPPKALRCAQHRLPVLSLGLCPLPLGLVDLGINHSEIEQPPMQSGYGGRLEGGRAEHGAGAHVLVAKEHRERMFRLVLSIRRADACGGSSEQPFRCDHVRPAVQATSYLSSLSLVTKLPIPFPFFKGCEETGGIGRSVPGRRGPTSGTAQSHPVGTSGPGRPSVAHPAPPP